jgi:hypothetical protein
MLTALRGEADTAPQFVAAIRAQDCPEGWRDVKRLIETGDEVAALASAGCCNRSQWAGRCKALRIVRTSGRGSRTGRDAGGGISKSQRSSSVRYAALSF